MKVLVTGGAGYVGTILRPYLESAHECVFFDTRPVEGASSVVGDITNEADVARACEGKDAAIQLVMANPHLQEQIVERSYDVHVKGMHVLLQGAADAGIRRIIYASSMSVYKNCGGHFHASEDDPPDASDVYGLTKRLGEDVCRAFADRYPTLSVIALRMVLPQTEERWREAKAHRRDTSFSTGPNDLGRLYLAALALQNHTGFDAVQACSDMPQKHLNLAKAKSLLGWEPQDA